MALLCAAVGAALTVTSDADEIVAHTVVGLLLVGATALFASRTHPGLWRFLLVGVFAGATVLIWGVGRFVLSALLLFPWVM